MGSLLSGRKGEQTAQSCVIACLQHLRALPRARILVTSGSGYVIDMDFSLRRHRKEQDLCLVKVVSIRPQASLETVGSSDLSA